MLGKSVAIQGKGYTRINLTKEETEQAMIELLEFNIKELKRTIMATKDSTVVTLNQTDAVKLLFEKQGIASYTWLQIKLDEKVEKIKSGE